MADRDRFLDTQKEKKKYEHKSSESKNISAAVAVRWLCFRFDWSKLLAFRRRSCHLRHGHFYDIRRGCSLDSRESGKNRFLIAKMLLWRPFFLYPFFFCLSFRCISPYFTFQMGYWWKCSEGYSLLTVYPRDLVRSMNDFICGFSPIINGSFGDTDGVQSSLSEDGTNIEPCGFAWRFS